MRVIHSGMAMSMFPEWAGSVVRTFKSRPFTPINVIVFKNDDDPKQLPTFKGQNKGYEYPIYFADLPKLFKDMRNNMQTDALYDLVLNFATGPTYTDSEIDQMLEMVAAGLQQEIEELQSAEGNTLPKAPTSDPTPAPAPTVPRSEPEIVPAKDEYEVEQEFHDASPRHTPSPASIGDFATWLTELECEVGGETLTIAIANPADFSTLQELLDAFRNKDDAAGRPKGCCFDDNALPIMRLLLKNVVGEDAKAKAKADVISALYEFYNT